MKSIKSYAVKAISAGKKMVVGTALAVTAVVGAIATAKPAQAAITMPTTLDFTNYDAAATIIVAALAVIWGVRKLIKLFNRS